MTRIFSTTVADRGEQILAVALYAYLAQRVVQAVESGQADVRTLAVLASEGAVVFFLLIRRSSPTISLRITDWLVAVAGTTLPLLYLPMGQATYADLGLAIVLIGLAINVSAKLVLRRSFGLVAANRGVKVSGPYRFVRHPMYAGYTIGNIGALLLAPNLWNIGIYITAFAFQVLRILAEERVLESDLQYKEFMQQVRYRLVPGVF